MSTPSDQGEVSDFAGQSRKLPEFDSISIDIKKQDYCVVVFCLNEGQKFQKQIIQMSKYFEFADIIVADGGSTDGSINYDFLKTNKVRALLTKTSPGGLSSQMRIALSWAMDEGYLGVIVVDGNGKDDVSSIPNFVELLERGFDHIQGSRFIYGGNAINTPISRLIALKAIHAPLISIASKTLQTDTTNGFRGYSRKLILDEKVNPFRDVFVTYELHYHLAIEAGREGRFTTIETPVTRSYPKSGKTPTKISPIKGNAKVLSILFKAVSGKYRVKS